MPTHLSQISQDQSTNFIVCVPRAPNLVCLIFIILVHFIILMSQYTNVPYINTILYYNQCHTYQYLEAQET